MKAIMYHYVREFDPANPYFKKLDIEDFKTQLDYFESEYGFVSYDDFSRSLSTGELPKGVILTFDDGLKDHVRYVLPVLQQKGLWGIFYIPAFIFQSNQLLDVHRVHLLLGRIQSKDVYHKLLELIDDSMLTHSHISEFKELTYVGQTNDDYTKMIKRTLNYYIGYQFRKDVMNELMHYFIPDEKDVFKSFYLNEFETRLLQNSGMVVGSHTINHPVMSKLPAEEQKLEVEHAYTVLENIVGKFRMKTFCYPYGGFHSFTHETEKILEENNTVFSFNVESRDINTHDLLSRPQALPRYDCNELPFGQCRDYSEEFSITGKI